ncbi:MAG TPA: hypothetical protein VJT73_10510 [Polyangiaceae bacterium]|nr:hypothetical protein [Polyangiaceae bacterium]
MQGHADSTEASGDAAPLSAARAAVVEGFLLAHGIPAAMVVATTGEAWTPSARSVTFELDPSNLPAEARPVPPACSDLLRYPPYEGPP